MSYLKLIRPVNCAMSAVAVFLGGLIGTGTDMFSSGAYVGLLLAMAAVVLFVGAGNALNDYEDRDIDKKAHPERPVPSGKISPKVALRVAYAFFILSALLSVFIYFPEFVFYPFILLAVNMAIMISYEKSLKSLGIPGNLSIAWLTSSLFLFGALSVGKINMVTFLFIAMSFLAILAREIAKDVEDMEGDRGVRRTAPITYGAAPSSALASFAFLCAAALSPLPHLLKIMSPYYLPAVLLADAIFIYCVILLAKKRPRASQNLSKVGMLVSLVAFAVGVVA